MLASDCNLRLFAKVTGLGPLFRINLTIENLSSMPMTELYINYSFDQ